MTYRELTDTLLGKLGQLNWAMVGTLARKYTWAFISKCADGVPDRIKAQAPNNKTAYLAAICRKQASDLDRVCLGKQVDLGNFDL